MFSFNTLHNLGDARVRRHELFGTLIALACLITHRTIAVVLASLLKEDQYSHILLIVPVSAALVWLKRRVFVESQYCRAAVGALVVLAGVLAFTVQRPPVLSDNNLVSLLILLLVAWTITAFVFCYGIQTARASCFPLLFLMLMVPFPDFLLAWIVNGLQHGSVFAAYVMLKCANIPVARHGIVLSIPGLDIEVANECSGIRSSLLLFVTTVVFAYLFVRSGWRRMTLVLFVIPLAIVKNGFRIFVLSTLALYADPSFLDGRLHHQGGIVFFLPALTVMGISGWLLSRSENTTRTHRAECQGQLVPFASNGRS